MENVQRTWTEAPASWNIRYRVNGFDEQITLRGETYAEMIETVDKARAYVGKLIGAAPATKSAADMINLEPPPAAHTPQTPTQTGAIGGTFHIIKMAVKPRTDGKVDLEFFEAGHKWADVKAAKTAADAALMLQPIGAWTPQHFASAAEYEVNCLIDWKPSANLNKNGQPYKNIAAVKPAQP